MIELNIYQTEELTETNGRIAESVIKRYLSEAFNKTEYEYNIKRDFEPVSVSTQYTYCGEDSVYNEWEVMLEDEDIDVAKDSNILLTTNDGDGCGSVGGNVCVAGVGRVDNDIIYREVGYGSIYDDIETAMHEVAHNLGFTHDHDDEEEGMQHLGNAWNDEFVLFGFNLSKLFGIGGTWHRTPCVTDTNVKNYCGEYIPEQKYDRVAREMYYHDCAVENFELV